MSAYADYATTENAKNYGNARNPVAKEALLGAIAISAMNQKKSLQQCCILDAGCGTGNYLTLVFPLVGTVVACDSSEAMLQCATASFLASSESGASFSTAKIDLNDENWPKECKKSEKEEEKEEKETVNSLFPAQFDAIYCCQVFQHLHIDESKRDYKRFEGAQNALNNFYARLHRGGTLILNLCTAEQRRNGFWWASLLPEAVERMIKRVPQPDDLRKMLRDAGFSASDVDTMRIYQERSETLQKDYADAFGPTRAEWRVADSTWALATEEEVKRVTSWIEEKGEQFWTRIDELMTKSRDFGQSTTYVVYKS